MLKEIIKEKGLSVYKVAKGSGIPYTTVNEIVLGKKNINDCSIKTISTLANFLDVPIESLYTNKIQRISTSWLEARNKEYIFPTIVTNSNYDVSRIHPLKQKVVNEIYEFVSKDNRIKKVIIFGSSCTIRCNKDSDIDVCVELIDNSNDIKNEISEKIQTITKFNSDILWFDRLKKGTNIYNNINKGVTIYE